MYEEFIQNRISSLRIQKGVTAREMSLSLGQNESYINKIENHKALPSLSGLFYICEYFGITPQEFFDSGNQYPNYLNEIIEDLKQLDKDILINLSVIVKEIAYKKSN